jgi:SAP domain-containing ribonucleoprotein
MPEYGKMKNAELEALLKERGLPHSGKKAELVARLQDDDKAKESESAGAPSQAKPKSTSAEDEIDWDDDATAPEASKSAQAKSEIPTEAPKSTTTSKSKVTAGSQPLATSVEPAPPAPAKPEDKEDGDAQPVTEEKPKEKTPVDFSMGLANTTLDEEIEKRKARAKKFGLEEIDPLAEDALKSLERAKKFGESGGPRGLNEALPDRSYKRGRDDGDDRGDFKRRGGRGRGGRRFGGGDRRRQQARGEQSQSNGADGRTSWMTEKDRAAAEARKARFAT